MMKGKKLWPVALVLGFLTYMATPVFARSITWNDFKDAGIAFWIFVIIGGILVLLQLIPAIILLFSFVGTMTDSSQRRGLQKQ